jgi:hypothetical protein
MDWINVATAVGTVGAAVFAGIAARTAGRSAEASRQLVVLERQRDDAAHEVSLWRQAQRVTVDTRGRQLLDNLGGIVGWDVSTFVTNASSDPIFKTRIKIVTGDRWWGPQLTGTLGPGQSIEVIARIYSSSDRLNGLVRFVDVEGREWVANSQTAVEPDPDVQRWIDEGREFAERTLGGHEKGTLHRTDGRSMPDFDAWARQFESD